MMRIFHQVENLIVQKELQAVDARTIQLIERAYRNMFKFPGLRRWWGENESAFGEALRIHVNREVLSDLE